MAARLRLRHQDDVRKKIGVSNLVSILERNAKGELSPELSPGRIQSAKILLDKSISNAATEVNADITGDVVVRWASAK